MNPKYEEETERYFQARGYKKVKTGEPFPEEVWEDPEGNKMFDEIDLLGYPEIIPTSLPNICESMPDWIEHVAKVMEGEGLKPAIGEQSQTSRGTYTVFHWTGYYSTEIKDHEILLASVEAATQYWEGKNGNL